MTPEQLVYRTLADDSAVAAIVGTRIVPNLLSSTLTKPYISYLILGAPLEYTHTEPTSMRPCLVQIDCWGDQARYNQLRELAIAAVNALIGGDSPGTGYFFIQNDGMDMPEPESRLMRIMIEAILWWNAD